MIDAMVGVCGEVGKGVGGEMTQDSVDRLNVSVELRICEGCHGSFAPKNKQQRFCEPKCRQLLTASIPGKRASYPIVSCILPGCTAPPFQMMRPDHRFCTPKHRVRYHGMVQEQAVQAQLAELRSEVQRLTDEVARLTRLTRPAKVKRKSA